MILITWSRPHIQGPNVICEIITHLLLSLSSTQAQTTIFEIAVFTYGPCISIVQFQSIQLRGVVGYMEKIQRLESPSKQNSLDWRQQQHPQNQYLPKLGKINGRPNTSGEACKKHMIVYARCTRFQTSRSNSPYLIGCVDVPTLK